MYRPCPPRVFRDNLSMTNWRGGKQSRLSICCGSGSSCRTTAGTVPPRTVEQRRCLKQSGPQRTHIAYRTACSCSAYAVLGFMAQFGDVSIAKDGFQRPMGLRLGQQSNGTLSIVGWPDATTVAGRTKTFETVVALQPTTVLLTACVAAGRQQVKPTGRPRSPRRPSCRPNRPRTSPAHCRAWAGPGPPEPS